MSKHLLHHALLLLPAVPIIRISVKVTFVFTCQSSVRVATETDAKERLRTRDVHGNRASAYGTQLDGATVKVVITTVNKT